jgi:hypothetical protein
MLRGKHAVALERPSAHCFHHAFALADTRPRRLGTSPCSLLSSCFRVGRHAAQTPWNVPLLTAFIMHSRWQTRGPDALECPSAHCFHHAFALADTLPRRLGMSLCSLLSSCIRVGRHAAQTPLHAQIKPILLALTTKTMKS